MPAAAPEIPDGSRSLPGGSMNISIAHIDQYLSEPEAQRPTLWLPPSVRAALEGGASDPQTEAAEMYPALPVADGRHSGMHSTPPAFASLTHPEMAPATHGRTQGPSTDIPADRLPEQKTHSYGTGHNDRMALEILGPRYKRIEKVTMTFGIACAMVFMCAFYQSNPAQSKSKGGTQQLAQVEGFGCGDFLCPHSGSCVMYASSCPEGDPFLSPAGIYRELVDCDGSGICNCKKSPQAQHLCTRGIVEFAALSAWGSEPNSGCDAFLCPDSGKCVRQPHSCSEGSPFDRSHSLYLREALKAKAKLPAIKAREAKDLAAATAKLAAKPGPALATSGVHAKTGSGAHKRAVSIQIKVCNRLCPSA